MLKRILRIMWGRALPPGKNKIRLNAMWGRAVTFTKKVDKKKVEMPAPNFAIDNVMSYDARITLASTFLNNGFPRSSRETHFSPWNRLVEEQCPT